MVVAKWRRFLVCILNDYFYIFDFKLNLKIGTGIAKVLV